MAACYFFDSIGLGRSFRTVHFIPSFGNRDSPRNSLDATWWSGKFHLQSCRPPEVFLDQNQPNLVMSLAYIATQTQQNSRTSWQNISNHSAERTWRQKPWSFNFSLIPFSTNQTSPATKRLQNEYVLTLQAIYEERNSKFFTTRR